VLDLESFGVADRDLRHWVRRIKARHVLLPRSAVLESTYGYDRIRQIQLEVDGAPEVAGCDLERGVLRFV